MNSLENKSYPDDLEYKIENEKINGTLAEVQNILEKTYGIKNLTTAEQIKIKHIVKHFQNDEKKYELIQKGNEAEEGKNLNIIFDVIAQWFSDEFDVNIENIPENYTVTNPISGISKKFEKYQKDEAQILAISIKDELKELKANLEPEKYLSMVTSVFKTNIINDDFSNYINAIRNGDVVFKRDF